MQITEFIHVYLYFIFLYLYHCNCNGKHTKKMREKTTQSQFFENAKKQTIQNMKNFQKILHYEKHANYATYASPLCMFVLHPEWFPWSTPADVSCWKVLDFFVDQGYVTPEIHLTGGGGVLRVDRWVWPREKLPPGVMITSGIALASGRHPKVTPRLSPDK